MSGMIFDERFLMKKNIALLPFFFIFLSFTSTVEQCLIWRKEKKIQWEDFEAVIPSQTVHAAISKVAVNYSYNSVRDSIKLVVEACFTKKQSWVIPENKTDYLLNHEQRHFDIAEINARKFRQYALKWDGKYNIAGYLSEGNDIFSKSLDTMQDTYDKETNHSINKKEQKKWDAKIDSLLNSYSSYENSIIMLSRRKKP